MCVNVFVCVCVCCVYVCRFARGKYPEAVALVEAAILKSPSASFTDEAK
jgi:hypothetical protein